MYNTNQYCKLKTLVCQKADYFLRSSQIKDRFLSREKSQASLKDFGLGTHQHGWTTQQIKSHQEMSEPLRENTSGIIYILKILFIFQKKRKGGGKKGRETLKCERDIDRLPLICAPTRERTHNPGMCPDQESNQRPFTLQDDAQPTEPHWSVQASYF